VGGTFLAQEFATVLQLDFQNQRHGASRQRNGVEKIQGNAEEFFNMIFINWAHAEPAIRVAGQGCHVCGNSTQ
jgi:hypothetical protein